MIVLLVSLVACAVGIWIAWRNWREARELWHEGSEARDAWKDRRR